VPHRCGRSGKARLLERLHHAGGHRRMDQGRQAPRERCLKPVPPCLRLERASSKERPRKSVLERASSKDSKERPIARTARGPFAFCFLAFLLRDQDDERPRAMVLTSRTSRMSSASSVRRRGSSRRAVERRAVERRARASSCRASSRRAADHCQGQGRSRPRSRLTRRAVLRRASLRAARRRDRRTLS
jgi:hypothetical protein